MAGKIIILAILPLAAFAGGAVTGKFMTPPAVLEQPEPLGGEAAASAGSAQGETHTPEASAPSSGAGASGHGNEETEFVKLNNQFIVPIVEKGNVAALVVMSLSIEAKLGNLELIYEREPKLRDGFLQILFDHANIGGFAGQFTEARNMKALRGALTDVARKIIGDAATGVLITEIIRKDN